MPAERSASSRAPSAGPRKRGGVAVPRLQFHQHAIPFEETLAREYAADVRHVHKFAGPPQWRAHRRRQQRQFLRGALENVQRDGIAFGGGRIHQRGQRGSARTGPIGSVEEVQHTIGAGLSGRVEKSLAERRRRSPIFFHAQRGAHRLADDIDSAALIAEDVAPSTGARGLAGGIAAESDSPRADGCAVGGGRPVSRSVAARPLRRDADAQPASPWRRCAGR